VSVESAIGIVALAQSGLPLVDETGEGVGAASVKAIVFRFALPAFAPVLHSVDVSFSFFSGHDYDEFFFWSRCAILRSGEVFLKAFYGGGWNFAGRVRRRGAKRALSPAK